MLWSNWLVDWGHPLHMEWDDIIPGFVWSVTGVNNPSAPWCRGSQHWFWGLCAWCATLTRRKVHHECFQSGIIVWLREVCRLTLCGMPPGLILVVKACSTGMHHPDIWSPTLSYWSVDAVQAYSLVTSGRFNGGNSPSEPLSEISSVLFCGDWLFN